MTTPTLSALEVEGHAANPAGEFDHLAGLDLVEPVDAGDAVTHRQHLADLGDIGLGAEIGDLLFQDGGDFCGADFHYPTPFITNCNRCSFDFSELSIMRLPTLTIRPPMRLASVFRSTATLPPTARLSASVTAAVWASLERHRRGDAGRHLAAAARELAEIGVDHVDQSEEAAVLGDQRHEAAHQIADPGLLQHGRHGLALIGAGEDGAAHEAAQIGALFDHGLDGLQIRRDGIELLGLVGQFEQCRSVACGEPGGAGMLGCQMEDPVSMKDPRRHGPDPEKPPARQALLEPPARTAWGIYHRPPGVATTRKCYEKLWRPGFRRERRRARKFIVEPSRKAGCGAMSRRKLRARP